MQPTELSTNEEQPEATLQVYADHDSIDLQTQSSAESNLFEIAGFWRRLAAFIIDGFIIGVPLIIIGFVFRDWAFSLGPWGRIVGYVIILVYWGFFNSKFRDGQTLGKRMMKIAIVDGNGAYLSPGKALLRAFILAVIGLLNRWQLPLLQNPILMVIATTIIFGGGLAVLYGFIFNRKTRQGLHDLVVGSYVVKAPPNPQVIAPTIPLIHKRITIGFVGLGLVLGLSGFFLQSANTTLGILEPEEWEEIQELHAILSENDEFFTVGVNRLNRQQVGSPTVMRDLNIEVWVKKSCSRDPEYCNELLKQIAHTAFENYDDIDNLTGMRIAIINQFDLGLATGNFKQGAAWTIEDWRKQLK